MVSYYLTILRRRALLVLVVTLIFSPLIFLLLTSGPKIYTSEAVIQVGTGAITDDFIDGSRPFEEPERRLATELEILTGQTVVQGAVERLRAQGWSTDVTELMRSITASTRGGSSAIGVVGTASEPTRAQELTSVYIDSYIDYRRDVNRDELERLREDLQQRLAATAAAEDSQSRYDTLAQWLEGVNLRLSVDTSGLKLISPASLPEEPTTSTTPVVAALAALLGALLLGCAQALLMDLARGSVRTREDAESLLPAPSLAEIPRPRGDTRAWRDALSDANHPTSAAARGLRLRLGGATPGGEARRVMLVGAEDDAIDTLTVAAALAASYGRAEMRVLLIADDVKGGQLRALDASEVDEDLMLDDPMGLRPTILAGVWIVDSTGHRNGDPGLLDTLEPSESLHRYSDSFDVVVLAMPPAPDDAEAVAIGHLVQAIVVVCALGKTRAKRLRRLVASLERNGAVVSGLALTEKPRRRLTSGQVDGPQRPRRVPAGAV